MHLQLHTSPKRRLRTGAFDADVIRVAFSPDGRTAAIGLWQYVPGEGTRPSHTVKVVDLATGTVRDEWFRDRPIKLAWSPDGRFLALVTIKDGTVDCGCSYVGTFALVSAKDWRVQRFPQFGEIDSTQWWPGGRYVMLHGEGAQPVHFIDIARRAVRPLPTGLKGMQSWTSSPDGRFVVLQESSPPNRLHGLDTVTWKHVTVSPGAGYVPSSAKNGQWVHPILPSGSYIGGGRDAAIGGQWVRLGAVFGGHTRNQAGLDLWWGKCGESQRQLIAHDVASFDFWPRGVLESDLRGTYWETAG
jgi:hypothetical protein